MFNVNQTTLGHVVEDYHHVKYLDHNVNDSPKLPGSPYSRMYTFLDLRYLTFQETYIKVEKQVFIFKTIAKRKVDRFSATGPGQKMTKSNALVLVNSSSN